LAPTQRLSGELRRKEPDFSEESPSRDFGGFRSLFSKARQKKAFCAHLQARHGVMTFESEIDMLQHRPPFLFVDTVVPKTDNSLSISGSISSSPESGLFHDRFLGPALVIEALAQLSGVLISRMTGLRNGGVLAAIPSATILQHRLNSTWIEIRSRLVESHFPMFTLHASALQEGEEFCTCEFVVRVNGQLP